MNSVVLRESDRARLARNQAAVASSRALWRTLLLVASAVLAALALYNIASEPSVSSEWPYVVAICFTGWAGVYLLATYRYFGSMYLFVSAYVLCLAIFHLGHLFAHVTGLYDLVSLVRGSMAFWHQQAGWYVMLSFSFIGIGAAVAMTSRPTTVRVTEPDAAQVARTLRYTYWIGIGLLCASFVGLVLTIGSVGNLLKFSRSEIFRGVGDTRGFGFFLMVVPSAAVLLVVGARARIEKMFAYGFVAVLVLAVLFLGYRSSVMFPGLIGAILWVKLGRKIPLPVVVVALLAVLIAIPTVSYLRAQGAYQDLSEKHLEKSLERAEDSKEILLELGGVSTVVAYVVKTVPSEWPYRLGQSYWLALTNAIPNVGLQMEFSGREEFLSKGVADKKALSVMLPADWYTYIVDRWMFDRGGGTGFSTIAEAYLNFGVVGVMGFFYAVGFMLARLDQQDLRYNPNLLVIAGAMLWPLLKTVRNSFDVFLKPLALILVSIWIWKLITFWRRRQ